MYIILGMYSVIYNLPFELHVDWLVQERCNSSALTMELRLSCTNPSMYSLWLAYTVDSRYLAPVGIQNSRARVKWFSRYLARRPRLANSVSQTHTPWRLQLSNSMLSDNRGTYVSRISTHIDIAPATNHNKQHSILIIMQQNCQITRCARQHTMDSVLKSAKLRNYDVATWQETEMASRMRGRPCAAAFHQSWVSFSVINSRIAFQITKISTFSTQ